MHNKDQRLGIVVIGRNEGKRLQACFESILDYTQNTVYVDSGSTDNSIEIARSFNIDVVSLDMSIPFSAGRARNEGASFLLDSIDGIEFIMFIDGDCSVDINWIGYALNSFQDDIAIVCGRRREKYPEQSIYNQLCDIEWNTPIGETKACGGDFIVRADLFKQHNGFNPSVIAGEEPELCYRIRKSGYKILRVNHDMTYHDADIHSFKQHWMRSVRCGYAYTLGLYMHNEPRERHKLKQTTSAIFWGLAVPILVLVLASINFYFLLLLAIYPLNVTKIYLSLKGRVPIPFVMSVSLVIGKFSETYGVLKFIKTLIFSKKHKIIEYK